MQREKQNERRRVSYERVSRLHDYLFFLDFDFLKLFEPDACLLGDAPQVLREELHGHLSAACEAHANLQRNVAEYRVTIGRRTGGMCVLSC